MLANISTLLIWQEWQNDLVYILNRVSMRRICTRTLLLVPLAVTNMKVCSFWRAVSLT